MGKKSLIFLGMFMAVLIFASVAPAESGAGGMISLADLVKKIGGASNTELATLNFFELNILKNSIYSAKGYQYAADREWLYSYFYDSQVKTGVNQSKWDLSKYSFPKPNKNEKFKIDKDMEKAIANIRVAVFKKVKSFEGLPAVDQQLNQETSFYLKKENQYIFGREITYIKEFGESIRREAHGYKVLMNLMENEESFDACELLGVYVGSVVLFKNIIEAKNGKIFTGTTGWEISQLIGVTPQDSEYDPAKLPSKERNKIQMLDRIIQKMTQSGIGDLPKELDTGNAGVSIEYYEGC